MFLTTNHRRTVTRVSSNLSTSTCPMQHLRNLDNTELVDTTNLTIHQSTGISIVLNLDECFVTEQVFHRFQFWNQFRTNVHYTSTTKYFGISKFRTSDDSSLGRSTVLSKNLVKTHQVLIRNYGRGRTFTSDGSIGGSSTCIQYSTSSSQQVFLENSFSQLYSTVHQFTRQVFFQLVIRIKVQGLLSKFVEETELMDGTFTRQTGKAYTVNTTTVLCQQRQFRGDVTNVFRRTIQITINDGSTVSINTLVVDVLIVKQWNVLIHLNSLTVVLRHVNGVSQWHEVLVFTGLNNSFLQPVIGIHLVGTSTINARFLTVNWGVIV